MKAIVAVDENWGIGYKGKLLAKIPDDMKFFRETTLNKVVVMGRTTFESLPNGKPLKNRINVVLSKSNVHIGEDIILCKSKEEALQRLNEYNKDDVFIIGGESIYNMFLPYCSEIYVTKIYNEYKADRFFVNLDKMSDWILESSSSEQIYDGTKFKFCLYKKGMCSYERVANSVKDN